MGADEENQHFWLSALDRRSCRPLMEAIERHLWKDTQSSSLAELAQREAMELSDLEAEPSTDENGNGESEHDASPATADDDFDDFEIAATEEE